MFESILFCQDVTGVTGSATRTELGIAISALAGVIAFLYRVIVTKNNNTETLLKSKWDECEKGHEQTRSELLTLSKDFGALSGKVEILSAGVLDRLASKDVNEDPKNNGIS